MTLDANFGVHLSASLDGLASSVDRSRKALETARAREPVDFRFQTSAACPSGGPAFVLSLGGPDTGFYWHVRRIVVGGLSWGTAAAGTAEAYVTALNSLSGSSGQGTVAQQRALSDMVDQASSLPNVAFYSQHELVLQAGENLVLVIAGGTAAQVYSASVQAQLFRTVAVGSEFSA